MRPIKLWSIGLKILNSKLIPKLFASKHAFLLIHIFIEPTVQCGFAFLSNTINVNQIIFCKGLKENAKITLTSVGP